MSYEVPNPYVVTTHPYPAPATGGKGGIWTRPVFGFPRMTSVQSVFKPDDFNDGNCGLRGLGADYRVGNGVFGTARDGGGVFGPSLYGLGGQADDIESIAGMILRTGTVSTAAFDLQNEFRAWYDSLGPYDKNFDGDTLAKAVSYRDRFNAANVAGGKSSAALPPSGSASQPVTKEAAIAVQTTLNAALTKAGYQPLTVDGNVGPGTCGAIAWYQQQGNPTAGAQFAAVCATKKPWKAPVRPSVVPYKQPAAVPAAPVEVAQAGMLGGAGTLAMIVGGGLAIGIAVIGKKKGWF
jgi:hypothetical protein